MDSTNKIVEELFALAESGNTTRLGKAILATEIFDNSYTDACTLILREGNVEWFNKDENKNEELNFYKSGVTLIEALVQKKAGKDLAKLAFFSWNSYINSVLSIRCLDSAICVGQKNGLCAFARESLSNDIPKFVECAANLILKLAEADCEDAFFIAGQILVDGNGVEKNIGEARKWFLQAALRGSSRATNELALVPDAYLELSKLTENPLLTNFYLRQSKLIKKANQNLNVYIPGQEIESLIRNGENGEVEFKELLDLRVKHSKSEFLRDVAAFLNSNGGCLLIGIDKRQEVVGVGKSFEAANVKNNDPYERHLFNIMLSNYGGDCSKLISIDFPSCKGIEICRINILPSKIPIFVCEGEKVVEDNLYIRTGNAKRKLTTKEALKYYSEHFIK